jgi:hypothetical protein
MQMQQEQAKDKDMQVVAVEEQSLHQHLAPILGLVQVDQAVEGVVVLVAIHLRMLLEIMALQVWKILVAVAVDVVFLEQVQAKAVEKELLLCVI